MDEQEQTLLDTDDASAATSDSTETETEYDEEVQDESGVEEIEEAVAEDVTPDLVYSPFVPTPNPHLNALAEQLEASGLDPNMAYTLLNATRHELQTGFTAQGYSQSYQEQARSVAPEWTRTHAQVIRRAESTLPVEAQGTASAAIFAFAAPAMEHAQRTGDVAGAIRMLQASAKGSTTAAQPPKVITRPVATPSPGAGAGGGTQQPRTAAGLIQKSGSRAARYLQGLGYDEKTSRELQNKIEA